MSAVDHQHQINVSRKTRTEEYAMKYNKDALKDPSFSYRSDVITTSLYCCCDDCIKYYGYGKRVKCIDPYLMDMRYTHWIYHDLVAASKTATTRTHGDSTSTMSSPNTSDEEPEQKRRKQET